MLKASEIKFGVEIESSVPVSATHMSAGRYHAGTQLENAPTGWNGQADCSISAGRGRKAVEVVSPILSGEQGLTEVFYMSQYLEAAGATFNRSMGLHVHVSIEHMTEAQKSRLAKVFRQYEGAFMAVCGENLGDRLENRFCKLSYTWSRLVDYQDRYRSLNFANSKGTVEFRLFSATNDPAVLVTAVYMCVGLVAYVSQMSEAELADVTLYPRSCSLAQTAANFISTIWQSVNNLIIPDEDTKDVETALMALANKASDTEASRYYRAMVAGKWGR